MRRMLALFLACLLLGGCQAAPAPSEDEGETFQVYYVRDWKKASGGSALGSVSVLNTYGDPTNAALYQAASAPETEGLVSAFPEDVTYVSYETDLSVITVELSEEYAALSGTALTLLDSCIVLTLCSLPGVRGVRITAAGEPHPNRTDRIFTDRDFVADDLVLKPVERELALYFKNNQGTLTRETRLVVIRENEPADRYVIEELLGQPKGAGLSPLLPGEMRLLTVLTENEVCTLNFPEEFFDTATGDKDIDTLTVYALVNSLTELPYISSVRFLREGEPTDVYGTVAVSGALSRDETLIAP